MNEFYLNDVVDSINRIFPLELAEKWDNSGLQIANENQQINKILITLDVDPQVVKYAVEKKINLIVSHHPIIFKPIDNIIGFKDEKSLLISELLKNNIAVLSIHTNADKVLFHKLADIFKLVNVEPLMKDITDEAVGIGSIGELEEEITLSEFLGVIKERLGTKVLKYSGDSNRIIKKVALCGGTCTSFISPFLQEKAIDVFVTSDIKYHEAQRAVELGVAVIDAGHFYTERVMLPEMKNIIEKEFNYNISVEVVDFAKDIFDYYI